MKTKKKSQKNLQQDEYRKPQNLKVQITPKNMEIDDRWLEFKILGKNHQPRSYHIAAIYKNTFYVHGGYNVQKGILSDFWKLQLQSKRQGFQWIPINQNALNYPGKLKCHSSVVYLNQLIIFGGQVSSDQNNNITYIFNFEKQNWNKLLPNIQVPKIDSHSAIVYDQKMIIYGGYDIKSGMYSTQFYQLDLNTMKWNLYYKPDKNTVYPEPRGNFCMIQYKGEVWIFGGTNGMDTLNDMWKFNLKNKIWQQIIQKSDIPSPRRNSTMFVYENYFFIFGGIQNVTKEKNDIFLYSPDINQWYKIHSSTNLIYEISPTLKKKKQSLTNLNKTNQKQEVSNRKNSSNKRRSLLQLQGIDTTNKHDQTIDKSEIMRRILKQNKLKKFLEKKNEMLKEFAETQTYIPRRKLSPISQNMVKTLESIGGQEQTIRISTHDVIYDTTNKFIMGKKPCPRDAHTANIYQSQILIFGGDRHLMSFCDLYYFDLKKGMESKLLYTTIK